MITLIIATRNTHKVQEIRDILSDRFQYRTLRDCPGAPTVVEDAGTFGGNATKKAVELARWVRNQPVLAEREGRGAELYCLADDSGLEVDALGGAPGVHSARFAGLDTDQAGNAPDHANNAKLLRLLAEVPVEKRTARFRCVIALTPVVATKPQSASPVCSADEAELQTRLFEGTCEGHLLFQPQGEKGFGYDPLFVPNGQTQSFAELGEATKGQISHRARALQELLRALGSGL